MIPSPVIRNSPSGPELQYDSSLAGQVLGIDSDGTVIPIPTTSATYLPTGNKDQSKLNVLMASMATGAQLSITVLPGMFDCDVDAVVPAQTSLIYKEVTFSGTGMPFSQTESSDVTVASAKVLMNPPPLTVGTYAPPNSRRNLFSNTKLTQGPGSSIHVDMLNQFAFYGKSDLTPVTTLASGTPLVAIHNNVIVVHPWSAPSVGSVLWLQQKVAGVPWVGSCTAKLLRVGVAVIGTTDATAVGLYGAGGTLNGKILKLNVDGAGESSLTLVAPIDVMALLTAIYAQWPALTSVAIAGASSQKITLTANQIVVGTGSVNAVLGLTVGDATGVSAVLDRPMVWPFIIGDTVAATSDACDNVTMNMGKVTGYANQIVEFTQARDAHVSGLEYILAASEIPVPTPPGIGATAFDVGCRDCSLNDSTIELPAEPRFLGGNGFYAQSNDGLILSNNRVAFAGNQGIAFLDCWGAIDQSNWTYECGWGHAVQRFDDDSYGCTDCQVIGGGDVGSYVGLWLWGAIRTKVVGFSSARNSQYGCLIDRNCGPNYFTNCSFTNSSVGVYISAGINGSLFTNLNTDDTNVGLVIAGTCTIQGWHHHSSSPNANAKAAFVSGTGYNSFRDIDIVNIAGGALGSVIDVQGTGTVVIDGGSIQGGTTTIGINIENAATVRISNLKLNSGVGVNVAAGLLIIGPNCDFSAITPASQIAVSGTGKVQFNQTGGIFTYAGSQRFMLLEDCYNTAIAVDASSPAAVGIPGIPGLQFTIANGSAVSFSAISSAAGDTGVAIAAGKTAIVRVNSTKHCVRVTADV